MNTSLDNSFMLNWKKKDNGAESPAIYEITINTYLLRDQVNSTLCISIWSSAFRQSLEKWYTAEKCRHWPLARGINWTRIKENSKVHCLVYHRLDSLLSQSSAWENKYYFTLIQGVQRAVSIDCGRKILYTAIYSDIFSPFFTCLSRLTISPPDRLKLRLISGSVSADLFSV